nr:odorant receptor 38 [Pachyrhinus yasumatsui]
MDQTLSILINLVSQHQYFIEFTTYVNKCCKNIIMMEFVLTSIDVATGALNIIKSQAVADAAYESRWYLLNTKGKQLTQLIIQRAQQRPLTMTIGPFGPMTLESFVMIMKAAYSYVSIMKN